MAIVRILVAMQAAPPITPPMIKINPEQLIPFKKAKNQPYAYIVAHSDTEKATVMLQNQAKPNTQLTENGKKINLF